MGRSAVLTGRIDARDRAKLRGRLDVEVQPEADPYDELWAWLERSDYGEGAPAVVARTDLDEYLQRTGHFEIPAHERLRRLAIFLEVESGAVLEVVDRVYEAGLRLAPSDHLSWHSRGITTQLAAGLEHGAKQERVAARALRWLQKALELDETDPQVPYSLGTWHYEFGSAADALEWFERVLALQPDHGWALLYRAYCLHDSKRWSDAVDAYEAVPLRAFEGPKVWRVDLLLEQKAYCRLRSGDREGALADFRRFLGRLEKEPHRGDMLLLELAREACKGPLDDELGAAFDRVAQLVEQAVQSRF